MKVRFRTLALVVALAASVVPLQAQAPGETLLARMQRVNGNLHSYEADLHVDVTTHGFPYISPSLDGKAYFEAPDRSAIVFTTVPALASQFKKVYPQLEPPADWERTYDVTPAGDDGTTAHFRLIRKKNGRIDHVDVTVDDRTATVTSMTYVYKDGGTIAFSQTYAQIDGNYVVATQTGAVDIPHYRADVASQFSNYHLNVKIDRTVFATE